MSSKWKLKTYLALFLTVFSVYILVPTYFNFQEKREALEKSGAEVPFYLKLFLKDQINLGLDLQGGIYLELEVDLQEALTHRSEIILGDLERFMREKGIAPQIAQVIPKTSTIEIVLPNPQNVPLLRDRVTEFYGTTMREPAKQPVVFFKMTSTNPEERTAKFQEMNGFAKAQTGILDLQLEGDVVQIVLKKDADPAAIAQTFNSQFGGVLQPYTPPAVLFLAQSELFQKKLREETLKQAVETVRNRIDRYGVAEPSIQPLGEDRVAIELPGVKDPDRAIGIVKRAGKLEFKLIDETVVEAKVQELVAKVRAEQKIPEGFTEEIVGQVNDALKGQIPGDSEIAFMLTYDQMTKKVSGGVPYLVKKKVEVSGDMLRNAQVSVFNNEPAVSLSFNPTGAKIFADLTTANVGKKLAILLDGNVNKVPYIKVPITTGEAQIELGGNDYQALLLEAEDLVVVLREGALPATLKEATKTVIGPSLGRSSIERSFNATLIAAAVVIIFMAFWYKWSGVLADIAVIINVLMIFAALTLFGATLTLPGVAGIVLTIGMAVDANVIILERIKEELLAGKSAKSAVDLGYSNGMRAVVDGHLTTFLSALVLYQFGTGPVRGFAVTLMIGIATTLYTAVALTRLVYDYVLTKKKVETISL